MSVARALAASMISACILASGASAQTYPDRPITLLVAFPPGGADDAIARVLGIQFSGDSRSSHTRERGPQIWLDSKANDGIRSSCNASSSNSSDGSIDLARPVSQADRNAS